MGPRLRGRTALAGGPDGGFAAHRAAGRTLGASVRMAGRRAAPEGRASATHGVRLGGSAVGPPERRGPRRSQQGTAPRARVARPSSEIRPPAAAEGDAHFGRPAGSGPHSPAVGAYPTRSVDRAGRRRSSPGAVYVEYGHDAGAAGPACRGRHSERGRSTRVPVTEWRLRERGEPVDDRVGLASRPPRGRTAPVRPARGPTNVGSGRTPRNPRAPLRARP